MFTWHFGETAEAGQRVGALRQAARRAWPAISNGDLSRVQSASDLVAMVSLRTGQDAIAAELEVSRWMTAYKVSTAAPGIFGRQVNDIWWHAGSAKVQKNAAKLARMH